MTIIIQVNQDGTFELKDVNLDKNNDLMFMRCQFCGKGQVLGRDPYTAEDNEFVSRFIGQHDCIGNHPDHIFQQYFFADFKMMSVVPKGYCTSPIWLVKHEHMPPYKRIDCTLNDVFAVNRRIGESIEYNKKSCTIL